MQRVRVLTIEHLLQLLSKTQTVKQADKRADTSVRLVRFDGNRWSKHSVTERE